MHDVVIIGGGIVGVATAVHLLRADPGLDVVIVEADPGYTLAATPRASGGVRQLFSCPENILLSQYTLQVVEDLPDVGWKPWGYLFIGGPHHVPDLEANLEIQHAHGVEAQWLEPSELARRYPVLATHDLAAAVLSPRDGWLDPHSFLQSFLRQARQLGTTFVTDRVTRPRRRGSTVVGLELRSGRELRAEHYVNAAGVWAAELAAAVDMPLPVEPMRRYEHLVHTPSLLPQLPFIKDPNGLAIRPQGHGLSVGLVDPHHPGGHDHHIDTSYFTDTVWPALAERIPQLDRLRLHNTSLGHYDQNRLDGNMILGNWPKHLDNFHVACGFSGHGMMHAPGVGRALAELIIHGQYRTINLKHLEYQRVHQEQPYPEHGIR